MQVGFAAPTLICKLLFCFFITLKNTEEKQRQQERYDVALTVSTNLERKSVYRWTQWAYLTTAQTTGENLLSRKRTSARNGFG